MSSRENSTLHQIVRLLAQELAPELAKELTSLQQDGILVSTSSSSRSGKEMICRDEENKEYGFSDPINMEPDGDSWLRREALSLRAKHSRRKENAKRLCRTSASITKAQNEP